MDGRAEWRQRLRTLVIVALLIWLTLSQVSVCELFDVVYCDMIDTVTSACVLMWSTDTMSSPAASQLIWLTLSQRSHCWYDWHCHSGVTADMIDTVTAESLLIWLTLSQVRVCWCGLLIPYPVQQHHSWYDWHCHSSDWQQFTLSQVRVCQLFDVVYWYHVQSSGVTAVSVECHPLTSIRNATRLSLDLLSGEVCIIHADAVSLYNTKYYMVSLAL